MKDWGLSVEKAEQEKLALALLDMINQKREEIKTLASEIMALKGDPKNVGRIRRNVLNILEAVAFFSSARASNVLGDIRLSAFSMDSSVCNDLGSLRLRAELALDAIQERADADDYTVDPSSWWHEVVGDLLERFCVSANSWNPITSAKGSKITIDLSFLKRYSKEQS